jgi:phosphate uptake regulator
MLQMIKALFSGESTSSGLLVDATERFLSMLAQAHELLAAAGPHLLDQSAPEDLLTRARDVDKASNKAERDIRKMLIEHLSFSHADGPACLVLMSVAKDGERLIDECRNLLESRTLLKQPVPAQYAAELRTVTGEVTGILESTRSAFAANDAKAALELVEGEKPFIDKLQAIYDRLLDDESLSPRQAIVISRAFRYVQRIRAHLANIASTVVFPVHRIDFAKRSFVEDAREELDKG